MFRSLTIAMLTLSACTATPQLNGPVTLQTPAQPDAIEEGLRNLGFAFLDPSDSGWATLELSSQDSRAQDSRAQDSRAQDSRAQDSRAQDSRAQDSRALCQTIYITDTQSRETRRGRFTDPDKVYIDVDQGTAGTLVISARGSYRDRYINRMVNYPCDVSSQFIDVIKTAIDAK